MYSRLIVTGNVFSLINRMFCGRIVANMPSLRAFKCDKSRRLNKRGLFKLSAEVFYTVYKTSWYQRDYLSK
jgi:hypothetical protein